MVKKTAGVGAVCRVMMKYLHPSAKIRENFPNHTSSEKLGQLIVIAQGVKKVNRKDQMCLIMRHDLWPNEEIYCVKRWAKIIQEGDPSSFFDAPPPAAEAPAQEPNTQDDGGEEIPDRVFHANGAEEDITFCKEPWSRSR